MNKINYQSWMRLITDRGLSEIEGIKSNGQNQIPLFAYLTEHCTQIIGFRIAA